MAKSCVACGKNIGIMTVRIPLLEKNFNPYLSTLVG